MAFANCFLGGTVTQSAVVVVRMREILHLQVLRVNITITKVVYQQ